MMIVHGHSDLLHCDCQEVGTRGTRGTSEEHLDFGDGVARSRPAKPKKRGSVGGGTKNTKARNRTTFQQTSLILRPRSVQQR